MEPSIEQQYICDNIDSNNIVIQAVAGSGKTTTSIQIALTHPDESILLLTYNERLKSETKHKVKNLGIKNLTVHNYHSFAVKYYNRNCYLNTGLKKHLITPPLQTFSFSLIIIDEIQDMTSLYFLYVYKKIFNDNLCKFKLCLMGDPYQTIYEFNGADKRFLELGHILFNTNKLINSNWLNTTLSQTFRVSLEQSNFINKCVKTFGTKLVSKKVLKILPRYILCDAYGNAPFTEVKRYLQHFKTDQIFILAPSIKSDKSPIKHLSNLLSHSGIELYIPVSDEERLDNDVIRNKLVFASFHQIKGLERDVVIVFSFDKGYFDFCARNADPKICPNAIYVALTRSLRHLSVIHHYKSQYLPFLRKELLNYYCEDIKISEMMENNFLPLTYLLPFKNDTLFTKVYNSRVIDIILSRTVNNASSSSYSVTAKNLCKNIRAEYIDIAIKKVKIIPILPMLPNNQQIKNINKTKQLSSYESVIEINEIAILIYHEFLTFNSISIIKTLNEQPFFQNLNIHHKFNLKPPVTIEKILNIAVAYACYKNNMIFKYKQIQNYDWFTMEYMTLCMERLNKILVPANKAEYNVQLSCNKSGKYAKEISTTLDVKIEKKIYKIICQQKTPITNKHILECVTDMFIYYTFNSCVNKKTLDIQTLEKKIEHYEKLYLSLQNNLNIFLQHNLTFKKMKVNTNIINDVNYMIDYYKRNLYKLYIKLSKLYNYDKFYIYNISTDELIEVFMDIESLKEITDYVIKVKYHDNNMLPDDIFISKLQNFELGTDLVEF